MDIIQKIQKLIAMSNSSNENEASIAAAKAQKLLAEYNLDIDDVMQHGKKEFITTQTKVMDVFAYLRGLGMAVGKAHFCEYYYGMIDVQSKRKNKKGEYSIYRRENHRFCGLRHNAEVAVRVFEYLQTTIFRLAQEAAKERMRAFGAKKIDWSFVTGFQNGACHRVAMRLYASIPTEEVVRSAEPGSNLPALLSLHKRMEEEIKEHMSGIKLVKKAPKKHKYDEEGMREGRRAGDSISLNKQVEQTDVKRLAAG